MINVDHLPILEGRNRIFSPPYEVAEIKKGPKRRTRLVYVAGRFKGKSGDWMILCGPSIDRQGFVRVPPFRVEMFVRYRTIKRYEA